MLLFEVTHKPKTLFAIDHHESLLNIAKKTIKLLKTSCKEWLKQTQNGKLTIYRGFREDSLPNNTNLLVFSKTVRKHRKPLDSSKNQHEMFNKIIKFLEKTANRSNSAFTSGDYSVASEYGRVYNVIPIGEFNYTWSNELHDWHNDLSLYDEGEYIEDQNEEHNEKINKAMEQYIKTKINKKVNHFNKLLNYHQMQKIFKEREYQDKKTSHPTKNKLRKEISKTDSLIKDITKDIQLYKKMNIQTKNSFIRNHKKDFIEKMYQNKIKGLNVAKRSYSKNLLKNLQIKGDDGTLIQAIRSENEIMIACKSILCIQSTFYKYYIYPLLQGKKLEDNADIVIRCIASY